MLSSVSDRATLFAEKFICNCNTDHLGSPLPSEANM